MGFWKIKTKMMRHPKVIISLTGGLGNQLFQLAAGLNFVKGNRLTLSDAFGRPRKNPNGFAEIFSFRLPNNVNLSMRPKASWVLLKTAGYLLRIGIAPRGFEKNRWFLKLLRVLSILLFSVHFRHLTKVVFSKNIGFSVIDPPSRNSLIIGYFQSYRWVMDPQVKQSLMNISPIGSEQILKEYELLAALETPLIVHVRLSDYLNQANFGIPSNEYYAEGIKKLVDTGKFSKVWLFSDDLETAKLIMPLDCGLEFRFFGALNESSAVTFEVMRLGFGYVIANSTFSWWAAFLCRNEGVDVIAPSPWFAGMDDPLDLIPKNWVRVKSIHKTHALN
jgi:hypothetical protein